MQFEWHILVALRSITIRKKKYLNANCSKIQRSEECRKVQKTLILAFEVFLQPLFMALFFPFIALLSFELMMGISTLKGYLNLLCSPSVPTYTMLCIVWIQNTTKHNPKPQIIYLKNDAHFAIIHFSYNTNIQLKKYFNMYTYVFQKSK